VAHFELVPKAAYLSMVSTTPICTSEHCTVVAKLDEKAPTFCVRPLPILDGHREPNIGLQIKKDPDFMTAFQVERTVEGVEPAPASDAGDRAIRRWLSPPVRAALLDCPDLWLRVDRKAMALSLYGEITARQTHELVQIADVLFAEHGAAGGQSLLGIPGEQPDAAVSTGA
jgi:hypothetical protein